MARFERNVSSGCTASSVLPDWLSLYVVIVEWLRDHGLLRKIGEKFRIYRQGGYTGEDVFMFLLALFCSGLRIGVKPFWERSLPHGGRLAALAGRSKWPSQASMSRALDATDTRLVTEFLDWLLVEVPSQWHKPTGCESYVVGNGAVWHVFDWDTKVQAFRQRGLPTGIAFPEPKRRVDDISAVGYAGRKRGQVQLSVSKVQHRGSSQWVAVDVQPGNGDLTCQQEMAHASVSFWAKANGVRPEECILVSDGAQGGRVQVKVGESSVVRFLSRACDYQVLESEPVSEILQEAQWMVVSNSGSGPQRYAAELGHKCFGNGPRIRYVVTRHQSFGLNEKARGAGREIDGWHYELFSSNVPTESFSASELVQLYYGRCAMENQLACENREFGLEHLFSMHPPGQTVAVGIAMFVWNMKLHLGIAVAQATGELPTQHKDTTTTASSPKRELALTTISEGMTDNDDECESKVPILPGRIPASEVDIDAIPVAVIDRCLERNKGWAWAPEKRGFICPAGHPVANMGARQQGLGSIHLVFRGFKRHCISCDIRHKCSKSTSRHFRKAIAITLTPEQTRRVTGRSLSPFAKRPRKTWQWILPTASHSRVMLGKMKHPTLLPAELRKSIDRQCWSIHAAVTIHGQKELSRPHSPFIAHTDSERQRRRKTWQQRRAWNALPESTCVKTTIKGSPGLAHLFGVPL